ncbi:MAG: glycine cleavage system protein GcvH [Peptoniphilaceae bacterium]|nr:glycine cleavage system protein GcvH [Peptoniphilaceae bacterium]MDD7383818.1 glycine cleavage system protein GcvH [Peptoniphilaceae bacterium]MDY3737605.1 glycine cleavage system protein GcvH [Peptoniphilaceae bacterium]
MSNYEVRDDLLYTKSHEWVKEEDGVFLVGLTDYAQDKIGDAVYFELPEEDDELEVGAVLGDVESVKAVSDIYSPVAGVVVEVNEELLDSPELVNESPYDSWLIKVGEVTEKEELLSASEYEAFLNNQKDE